MRPEKLTMENFGPFSGRVELDFSKLEDIFLITGKTGAGKTTIFDAICFALYGKVPGSRGDHLSKLYSDHAEEDGESVVSLEFSVGEKYYRADRTPRQERKKKRGCGTMTVEETLALYEITSGAMVNLVSKKSEGDARLKEITGLEAEEFFKVVLLPQGEFAEFLKQNTSERQKVLGKLFPVEHAVRVKELARKKAGDAAAQADAAAGILDEIGTRVSEETYPQAQAAAQAAVENAAQKSRDLESEQAQLQRLLSLRHGERDADARLNESRKRREEAAHAGLSINEKSTALSRSRAARPLEQHLRGMESARTALETAETALAASGEEKSAAEQAAAEAEKLNRAVPAAERELLRLRENRPALVQMLEDEEKLTAAEEELRQLDDRTEKLSAQAESLQQELARQEASIEETENLAAGQEALEEKMQASKSIKDTFMKFRTYRQRIDELEKEQASTHNEICELERSLAAYEKNIPVLQAELFRLREEKAHGEQADMAAHLSAHLEAGKPCPVCGSLVHPSPADSSEASPFALTERINAQEASL
ncbi:MAG: AAA family ATPase, partial [Treponema sp.]|nr:AAA family ATPase [Treponema sp.]